MAHHVLGQAVILLILLHKDPPLQVKFARNVGFHAWAGGAAGRRFVDIAKIIFLRKRVIDILLNSVIMD